MQTLRAFSALWWGLRDPRRIPVPDTTTAVAIFAAAVMVLSAVWTLSVYVEQSSADLRAESELITAAGPRDLAPASSANTSPQREFTAVLGGALMRSVVTQAAMAAIVWLLFRFLTNATAGFSAALAAVSATASIEAVRALATAPLHMFTGSMRFGLSAGILVSPADHPHLFLWLQRLDLLSLWHYIAACMALAVWQGLHHRYGWVVGGVTFAVVQILMGAASLVAWVLQQGM